MATSIRIDRSRVVPSTRNAPPISSRNAGLLSISTALALIFEKPRKARDPSARRLKTAFASLRIVADYRQRISRRHVFLAIEPAQARGVRAITFRRRSFAVLAAS